MMMIARSAVLAVSIFFLFTVSEVTSQCPPSSGIYLMHNGDCYPNGSYFHDYDVSENMVSCVFSSSSGTGHFVGPNGTISCPGTSASGHVGCIIHASSEVTQMNVTVLPNISFGILPADDGWYKCCMPNNCSDLNTNVITFNIFRWAQIADMKVNLPSDITVLPQIYTVHAIKIGSNDHHLAIAAWYSKSGTAYTYLTTSLCNREPGFGCAIDSTGVLLDISSGTYDFSLTITWNGENITSGLLSQSSNNGDHIISFYMIFGVLSFYPVKRTRTKTITVPGSAPSSLTEVNKTATTITVSWTALDSSDADGYVVNVTSDTDTVQTVQVEGSSNNIVTLNELMANTTYSITVRAYQELLGPASTAISVQTSSGGYCSSESNDSDRGRFVWPETDSNMRAVVACPYGPNGVTVSRVCTSNGYWESPNVTRCLTAISSGFKNISKVDLTTENNIAVLMSLNELVINSTDSNDRSIDNIIIVSNILNQTAILISGHAALSTSNLTMITENAIQILNSIGEWPTITRAEGNQIIQSFERIVDAVLIHSNDTNVDIVESNIVFAIRKFAKFNYNGLTFTATASNGSLMVETDDNFTDTEIGSITVPKGILSVTTDAKIKLAFSLYNKSVFFPIRDPPPNTIVGSSVISARIAGVSDGTQLPDPVVITLALKINNSSNPRCVYWNFTAAEGRGNWSTDGCTVEAANSSVTCHCNHLTNFAILVDISRRTEGPTQSPHHIAIALDTVSYVGAGISLVGLILTIITLVIFKKIRTKDASKFHIQLCFSLSLMLLVFVSGISEVSPKEGCITVGVLIHYFALVAWMWMGAEALLMFQKLQIVFVNVSWRYHLTVSIVCWGLPLIPVTILLVVDYNYYLTLDENGSGYCFIGELIPFLVAFLCPIVIILLFNIIVYILIIRVLVLHTARKIERMKISLTTTDAVKMVASFISILILFGLTWVLAIFTFITEPSVSYIIQFFFCFFNAFQGFFIFLFFIVLNSESRNAWKSFFCRESVSKDKMQSTVTQARQNILLSSQNKTSDTGIEVEISFVAGDLPKEK